MSLLIEPTAKWQTSSDERARCIRSRPRIVSHCIASRPSVVNRTLHSSLFPFSFFSFLFFFFLNWSPWVEDLGELLIKSHEASGVIVITAGNRKSVADETSLPAESCRCSFGSIDSPPFFSLSVVKNFQPTASSSGLMPLVPGPGAEFANFGDRDLLLGLTSEEAWVSLTDDDLQVRWNF